MKKQYVITDPCYILSESDWSECCKEFDHKEDKYDRFNQAVTKKLNDLARTADAIAIGTGFGDWCNEVFGSPIEGIQYNRFCADAGMVCVVEYTKPIQDALEQRYLEDGCAALVEVDEPVKIMALESNEWSRIIIKGNHCHYYTSDANMEDDGGGEDD